jgi:hypothetical protein
MTTRSEARSGLACVLNISRINRLARFLTTAPPSFLLATIPIRLSGPGAGAAMRVRYRPWALRPASNTRWNSPRRRMRRAGGRALDKGERLPRSGHSEALPPLRAPPGQDLPALLGRHPHEKPVGSLAVPAVRLKCAYALGHDSKTSVAGLLETRETQIVTNPGQGCQRVIVRLESLCYSPSPATFPPGGRRVSPRRFPQLWKKLWKSIGAKVAKPL